MDMVKAESTMAFPEERDPYYFIDAIRHQEVSPLVITSCLIKLCDSKANCSEEMLAKFSSLVVEKLICESPLTEILRTLDTAEFYKKLYNNQQFAYNKFLIFCRYLCSSDKNGYDIIGSTFFSKVWQNNSHFQYEIIKFCILSDWVNQILNSCTHSNLTKKVPQIEILKCPIEYENDYQISCWKYQCLSQILLNLSENQLIYPFLEEIFFLPLNKCPDLLVFALLECHGIYRLKDAVLTKALLKFIYVPPNTTNPNPNSTLIIQRIWPSDYVYSANNPLNWAQKSLLTSMVELYTSSTQEEQSYKLSKILDLSQDLKVLNVLLSSNTLGFVIDLACFASRREYLKLDKWLNDKIQQIGASFIDACIQFLKRRCPAFGANETLSLSLPVDTHRIILTCLRQQVSDSPKTSLEVEIIKMSGKFTQWYNQFNQLNKSNQFDSVGSQHYENPIRSPNFCPETDKEFSKEIEEEADSYFQRIYNQELDDALSIDNFLEIVKRFQESQNTREQDIAACIIRNLFKEYPFLGQYPEKELVITGEIFGGIIMNNNVKGFTLVRAMRFVSNSLMKPHYFIFGQSALNKLKTRLKEFPQFCSHLYNMPQCQELPPALREYIDLGRGTSDQKSKRVTTFKLNSNTNNTCNSNNSASDNQFQLMEISPPNSFQDKIAFIVNNLSQVNLAKKAEEFKELFVKEKDQYLQWFSQYFVMKRVSLEANFHELYANFIVKVCIADLSAKILNETYHNIKLLLCTNKETDNFNDRTLLKNLGQWLGLITLAQNKPILTINLDLRNLLIEAYHKGIHQLQYVVPFVTKVLLGSAKSKVFRPPCPWTVKLIKILVELHSESDLKLNLKFEVEVLCQNLDLDLKQYVGKSDILKNEEYFAKLIPQLGVTNNSNNNNSNNMSSNFIQNNQVMRQNNISMMPHQTFDVNTIHHQTSNIPNTVVSCYNEVNIHNLSQSVIIPDTLQIILGNPSYKCYIGKLIEKCVQDWVAFIAERIIKVCLGTTEQLVKKDFAHETNVELIRECGHKMLRCLVSGYALINSEESLTSRLQTSLHAFFQSKINASKEIIDSTISTLINENIKICVFFVQKICMERAIEEFDKRIKPEFNARQNAKVDGKKSSVISVKQLQIYEEMGRNIAGFNQNSTSTYTPMESSNKNNFQNPVVFPSHNYPVVQNEQAAPPMDSFVIIYDKLMKHLDELILEFETAHNPTQVMHQVLDILKTAKQNARDQVTAIALIKHVINGLRELIINHTDGNISDYALISRARDFYLLTLKALTDQRAFNHRFTTTNVTRFIIQNWISINQTFPDDLFDTLFKTELINANFMDSEFHQLLENGNNTVAITIILNFLKCYLSRIPQFANNFILTLDLLQRIAIKVNQSNHPLINDLKNILNLARLNLPTNEVFDSTLIMEKFDAIIKEWVTYFNSNKNLHNSFTLVVKNMSAKGLLKSDDLISSFFKCFLETCVERCYQLNTIASQHQNISLNDINLKCYEYIDAFSVLVLLFIKQSGNQGNNIEQKFQFLSRILNILANTAHQDQEVHLKDFLPLTYYRILLYIFIEFFYSPCNLGIQDIFNESVFEVFKWHLVRNYCNVLHSISPLKTPSFTFAWLDFISHRVFIGKCLDNSHQINYKTWHVYYTLLNDLLLFLRPILQSFDSYPPINMELYKGTLKLFLLLYHDFPEFLCEFCYNLCDTIPIRAIQLRNIILSAHPMNAMDGSSLPIENLYEMLPHVSPPNSSLFEYISFKKELENFILQRAPHSFLNELFGHISSSAEKQSLINALTLFIGLSAIQTNKPVTLNSVSNSVHFEIFQHLLVRFDSHGRYILINSLVDHLRYANTETLFFIYLILALFRDHDDNVREQIIRVLLERIIAQRPHPWGIMYLINELVRNPNFKLLEHTFIKFVPEIEKYFSQSA